MVGLCVHWQPVDDGHLLQGPGEVPLAHCHVSNCMSTVQDSMCWGLTNERVMALYEASMSLPSGSTSG